MRSIFVILVVVNLLFTGHAFSQSKIDEKPTVSATEKSVAGKTIADDLSDFFGNQRVRQFLIFLIVVYLGYRRFKKKRLKEGKIETTEK